VVIVPRGYLLAVAVAIDGTTGALVANGQKLFPLGLSEAPPFGSVAPGGNDAWTEIASAGANFIRSGRSDWSLRQIDQQIAQERTRMDHAGAHQLLCWPRLTEAAANLPTTANSPAEQLLVRIVNGLKDHPALGAWKGVDEPANPNRPATIPAAGLARAYTRLKQLDSNHPVVITQAPLGSVNDLVRYRPAFDITGADIYPIAYPPGEHSDLPNKDISVVGDVTKKMIQGGLEAGLDDAADRLERHASAPAAAGSRASVSLVATGKVHGVSGDREWRSWPGVFWWGSDGSDASARRATRLELDVLGARPSTAVDRAWVAVGSTCAGGPVRCRSAGVGGGC
jgi:hypothetical protein